MEEGAPGAAASLPQTSENRQVSLQGLGMAGLGGPISWAEILLLATHSFGSQGFGLLKSHPNLNQRQIPLVKGSHCGHQYLKRSDMGLWQGPLGKGPEGIWGGPTGLVGCFSLGPGFITGTTWC